MYIGIAMSHNCFEDMSCVLSILMICYHEVNDEILEFFLVYSKVGKTYIVMLAVTIKSSLLDHNQSFSLQ